MKQNSYGYAFIFFFTLISHGVFANLTLKSKKHPLHRCFLEIPEHQSEFGIFEATGKTKQEATGRVLALCEQSLPFEERKLCHEYAFQDSQRFLGCSPPQIIP